MDLAIERQRTIVRALRVRLNWTRDEVRRMQRYVDRFFEPDHPHFDNLTMFNQMSSRLRQLEQRELFEYNDFMSAQRDLNALLRG